MKSHTRAGAALIALLLMLTVWTVPAAADSGGMEIYTRERVTYFTYTTGEELALQLMTMPAHPDRTLFCVSPYHTGPYQGDPVRYTETDATNVYADEDFLLGAAAIVRSGYPNRTTINGHAFTPTEAQYLTNVAIWWLYTELGLPISKPPLEETLDNGYTDMFQAAVSLLEIGRTKSFHHPMLQAVGGDWIWRDGGLECAVPLLSSCIEEVRLDEVPDEVVATVADGQLMLRTENPALGRQPVEVRMSGLTHQSPDSLFWVVPDDDAYQSMLGQYAQPRSAVETTFMPRPADGRLEVHKTDAQGTVIGSDAAVFSLRAEGEESPVGFAPDGPGRYRFGGDQTQLTAPEGVLELTDIPEAENGWLLRELQAPDGYLVQTADRPVTPSPDQPVVEVANTYEMTRITVVKEDAETGDAPQGEATLSGARFAVWHADFGSFDAAPDDRRAVVEIPEGSDRVTTGLLRGGETPSFYVEEVRPPDGYLCHPGRVAVTAEGDMPRTATVTVANEVIRGRVEIRKLAEPLGMSGDGTEDWPGQAGVRFTVTAAATGAQVAELVTGEDGVAVSEPLPYGTYRIEEQELPAAGYELAAPVTVEIREDGVTVPVTVRNGAVRSEVTLIKTDATGWSGRPSAGAVFQILRADGTPLSLNGTSQPDKTYDRFTTDDSGSVTLPEPLTLGTYAVQELQAPPGFVLSEEPVPFDVAGDGVPVTVALSNLPTGVLVQKQCAATGTGLPGAVFEMTDGSGEPVGFRQDDSGWFVPDPEGTASLTSGPDGRVHIAGLAAGAYDLKECRAPDGYLLPEVPLRLTVTGTHSTQQPQKVVWPNDPVPPVELPEEEPPAAQPEEDVPAVRPEPPEPEAPPIPDTGTAADPAVTAGAMLWVSGGILTGLRRVRRRCEADGTAGPGPRTRRLS